MGKTGSVILRECSEFAFWIHYMEQFNRTSFTGAYKPFFIHANQSN